MIRRAVPLKRGPAIQGRAALRRSSNWVNGRRYDSPLEATVGENFYVLERAGLVRNFIQKPRHEMHLAPGLAFCECGAGAGDPPGGDPDRAAAHALIISGRAPKFRAIFPDFEFEELVPPPRTVYPPGLADSPSPSPRPGEWLFVTADAKGWLDPQGSQAFAYKMFERLHGRAIRLITRNDAKRFGRPTP